MGDTSVQVRQINQLLVNLKLQVLAERDQLLTLLIQYYATALARFDLAMFEVESNFDLASQKAQLQIATDMEKLKDAVSWKLSQLVSNDELTEEDFNTIYWYVVALNNQAAVRAVETLLKPREIGVKRPD